MPGLWNGKQVTVQDVYEAVGAYDAGKMTLQELTSLENVACPSAGSCAGIYTTQIRWHQLVRHSVCQY